MGEGPGGWIGGRAMHAAALSLPTLSLPILALTAMLLPTGCTAPSSYMGGTSAPGAAAPAVQSLTQQTPSEDPEDILREHHSFQPLFNGLKSRQGDWRRRITSEGGARFADRETIRISLALIAPEEPQNESMQSLTARACTTHKRVPRDFSPPDIRLSALCFLAKCWDGGTSLKLNLRARSRHWQKGRKDFAKIDEALFYNELVSLSRAANRCADTESVGFVSEEMRSALWKAKALLLKCKQGLCSEADHNTLFLFRQLVANYLIASIESRQGTGPGFQEAALVWRSFQYGAEANVQATLDPHIEALCTDIGLDQVTCRDRYPYSYFLEERLLALVRDPSIDVQSIPIRFCDQYDQEIRYRRLSPQTCRNIEGA